VETSWKSKTCRLVFCRDGIEVGAVELKFTGSNFYEENETAWSLYIKDGVFFELLVGDSFQGTVTATAPLLDGTTAHRIFTNPCFSRDRWGQETSLIIRSAKEQNDQQPSRESETE